MSPRERRSEEEERNSEVIIPGIFKDVLFPLKSDIPNRKPYVSKIMLLYDWQNK